MATTQTTKQPLTGCIVAVDGTIPGMTHTRIQDRIIELGGIFVRDISQETTHLIATVAGMQNQTRKMKIALTYSGIRIVSVTWIEELAKGNFKASEAEHVILPAKQVQTTNKPAPKCLVNSLVKNITSPAYQVYISSSDIIYDAALNFTDLGETPEKVHNLNKFYHIQILHQLSSKRIFTWTRWGRVGEFGRTARLGKGDLESAIKQFEAKFKDKTGIQWENRANNPRPGKYAYLGRDNGQPAKRTSMSSCLPRSMFDFYDQDKSLPLGNLSKTTIECGYQTLNDLSEVIQDSSLAIIRHGMNLRATTIHLSSLYYTLIPHSFGSDKPAIIDNNEALELEKDLVLRLLQPGQSPGATRPTLGG